MRKNRITSLALVFAMGGWIGVPLGSIGQEATAPVAPNPEVQTVRVPFSDPSRPGLLKIGLTSGSITVRAHSEPDAVFEIASPASRKSKDKDERKAGGMFVISNNSFGFEVSEEDNVMDFDTDSWNKRVAIEVRVPVNTSLELSTVNSGHIIVEGVKGELELSNVNGRIEATNVSGSVVAETVNGSVKVSFSEITPDRFMAFSTLNGSIDVTFPPNVKADLHLDSGQGSIYSDFKIELDRSPVTVREDSTSRGTRVKVEKKIRGTLNGGGPEMRFETYNGSIYIRNSAGSPGS